MNDITDAFSNFLRLQNGMRVVGLMIDSQGNRYCLHFFALSSTPPCGIAPLSESTFKFEALKILDAEPTVADKPSTTDLQGAHLSPKVTNQFRRSVILYDTFLQAIRSGQTEDTNLIRDDFRSQFAALEGEMAKNAELQKQMLEMQQNMVQMQQQTLDRLALIQNRVQAILVQNFELHEYPIPRLFIVLPKDPATWNPSRLIQNKFRLYFLCECGEHTRSSQDNSNGSSLNANNNTTHHIHLAKHEGYDIESPTEFFRQYGSYILDMLNMVKYGVMVAGLAVPALVPLRMVATIDQLKGSLNHFAYNIEPSVNQAIKYLEALSTSAPKTNQDGSGPSYADELEALEGADLRRLGMFLKGRDKERVLGNLYRVVTSEGHVKLSNGLKEVIQVNGGSFEEHTGRVEISLSSSIIAGQFYRTMECGRFIQELKITLAWGKIASSDAKELQDAVHRSNIVHLDLSCSAPLSTGGLLSMTKVSNPLWELILDAQLQALILSDYQGFFVYAPRLIRTTNLRVLKLSERFRWRKDGPKLMELIRKSPKLSDLSLRCPEGDAREAFTAIADAVAEGVPLQNMEILGGFSDRLLARFEQGRPNWIDAMTSDPLLLPEVTCFRSLHFRSVLSAQPEVEQSILSRFVPQNPGLVSLTMRSHPSRFLDLFESIKTLDTNLKSVRLYTERIQLTTPDIRDPDATMLELASIESTGFSAESLLRAYGSRLTKLRISPTKTRHQQPVWNKFTLALVLFQDDVSRLRNIELTCSAVSVSMLGVLETILGHPSFPAPGAMSQFEVEIDIVWQQESEVCAEWAKFIAEHSRRLTMVKLGDVDFTSWSRAIHSRGGGGTSFDALFGRLSFKEPNGEDYGNGFPITLHREQTMNIVSNIIREKPQWWLKYKDPTISTQWKQEIQAKFQESEGYWDQLGDPALEFIFDELEWYAQKRQEQVDNGGGKEVTIDVGVEGTRRADGLIPEALKQSPRLGSSFPVSIRGGSNRVTKDEAIPALESIGAGEVMDKTPIPGKLNKMYYSDKFQWLPTDFDVTPAGKVKAKSYINNLHPEEHKDMYPVVEEILEKFLPLFEDVIGEMAVFVKKEKNLSAKGDWYPDQPDFDTDDSEAEELYYETREPKPLHIPKFSPPKDIPQYDLRTHRHDKPLQVIVKLDDIELTPKNPKYAGGTWHVEGMANENIVATGIYYYHSENISESRLNFRIQVKEPMYEQGDHNGVGRMYDLWNGGPLAQDLDGVITKQDRCLVFPNIYQHQVQPFQLEDDTQQGSRKILVFFLVNPEAPTHLSTTHVPPQQKE
ncbi:hypothetical protein BGZ95_005727 [Linnemannia exigua]|uniref:Uncharacterized protein n=1 Tax=Linnemannia exigua TaxID=604196 RepID=A0AAD4DGI1_9FUNG|nr:hypothetical protein BGZ95_005727 [Linnemannia exigua]